MRLAGIEAEVTGDPGGRPVVLLHGIGLGPWLWEPWIPVLSKHGLRCIALRMPGHGDGSQAAFADQVRAVEEVLDAIGEPASLVGHSMGGLVAQVVASRRSLSALALVCPLPPGQVRVLPPFAAVWRGLGLVRAFARGQELKVEWPLYRAIGLEVMEESAARACFARTSAWPHALVRDLAFARPTVNTEQVKAPVLVCIGQRDRLVPWQTARTLGDIYEAVTWRYDDLGHMPPWEPGGARMGRDLATWLAAPSRPQVIESEAFGPAEGVGRRARQERRGEAMGRRSAYGQKGSAR